MKWYKVAASTLILITLLTVTGCGMIAENDKFNYKSARKLPPLDIPPDLIAPVTDDRYLVPNATQPGTNTYFEYNKSVISKSATSLSAVLPLSGQGVYIDRAGTQRWLVVLQKPEVVWPIIKEFWQDLGFLIKIETPETGIIETDWAESRAAIPQDFIRNFLSTFLGSLYSTAERDKFRTRLERGEDGATEIYISHRGMDEVVEGGSTQRTIWQPRPADPGLEAEMLTRLMLRFGVQEEQVKHAVASTNNLVQARAYLDPENKNILVIKEAFDRAWRRVGLSLDRIGFTVEDRNRSDGIYFVRYVNPDLDKHKTGDDDGILSKLIFWRGDTAAKTKKYHIKVSKADANSSLVKVYGEDGVLLTSNTASRILNLLEEQLK